MEQVAIWGLTGWLAGWSMRHVMRRRGYGVVSDGATGVLGAMVGGWLFHRIGVVAPENLAGHTLVALVGAGVLILALSGLRRAWMTAAPGVVSPRQLAGELETQVARLGEVERRVLSAILRRRVVSRDPDRVHDALLSFGDRVADRVAAFGGSWPFIGLFLAGMVAWMALNGELSRPFDAYPYILLNLVLSCVAALQAPVIMMSQNRQAARDRQDARTDYEVNLRAEMEIMALHEKLDAARAEDLRALVDLLRAQGAQLDHLRRQVDGLMTAGGRDVGQLPS